MIRLRRVLVKGVPSKDIETAERSVLEDVNLADLGATMHNLQQNLAGFRHTVAKALPGKHDVLATLLLIERAVERLGGWLDLPGLVPWVLQTCRCPEGHPMVLDHGELHGPEGRVLESSPYRFYCPVCGWSGPWKETPRDAFVAFQQAVPGAAEPASGINLAAFPSIHHPEQACGCRLCVCTREQWEQGGCTCGASSCEEHKNSLRCPKHRLPLKRIPRGGMWFECPVSGSAKCLSSEEAETQVAAVAAALRAGARVLHQEEANDGG